MRGHRLESRCYFNAKGVVSMLAWGSVPECKMLDKPALKARFSLAVVLIPNITFIKVDSMLAQQLAIFLLEYASAMVLLLFVNVLQHRLKLTRAH